MGANPTLCRNRKSRKTNSQGYLPITSMNKAKILIASIGIILLLWIASWFKFFGIVGDNKMQQTASPSPTQEASQNAELVITFDDGSTVTFTKEKAVDETAFSILKEVTDAKSLTLETTQYDFGVFVKSINGEESSADKSWIYFVNGQSGQVAADQYKLKPGDKVEWKYVVPEGE